MSDDGLLAKLAALEIETPSWGYGNSGTRFHVYPWPGAARTVTDRCSIVRSVTDRPLTSPWPNPPWSCVSMAQTPTL